MNNSWSPAYDRGVLAGNGIGSIFALDPDGRSEAIPVPDGYVIDGFTWGSASSESSRATAAAALLRHLASVLRWGVPSEWEIREFASRLVAGLRWDRPWRIFGLDLFVQIRAMV